DPPLNWPPYKSTALRAPARAPVPLPPGRTELTGPVFGQGSVRPTDSDLTAQHAGPPQGERIVVHGRVLDSHGRPVPHTLVEVWQTNAAGRYRHAADRHPAPLDPNFTGAGRCLTDAEGRYRFLTVRPGAYPWKNSRNPWRPAPTHFSLFARPSGQRRVTQRYF